MAIPLLGGCLDLDLEAAAVAAAERDSGAGRPSRVRGPVYSGSAGAAAGASSSAPPSCAAKYVATASSRFQLADVRYPSAYKATIRVEIEVKLTLTAYIRGFAASDSHELGRESVVIHGDRSGLYTIWDVLL